MTIERGQDLPHLNKRETTSSHPSPFGIVKRGLCNGDVACKILDEYRTGKIQALASTLCRIPYEYAHLNAAINYPMVNLTSVPVI